MNNKIIRLIFVLPLLSGILAQAATQKIVGGKEADSGEHDYYVALLVAYNWDDRSMTTSPSSSSRFSWSPFAVPVLLVVKR